MIEKNSLSIHSTVQKK
ncbi:hypothetical protein [Buchnera aphidicola]